MTRNVTLDNLILEHPLWKNPRTITALSAAELDDLGEDLIDRGQKMALLVQQIKNEDGSISELVLDGQRRCLALKRVCKIRKKGEATMTLIVDDYLPSPVELTVESSDRMLLDALAVGIKRAGLSSYEQTEAVLQLRHRHPEWTMETVGKAIGRSESWVSRFIRARKLASPAVCQAWGKNKITDEQFKDLADIHPYDRQDDALAETLGLREKGGREAHAEARHKIKEEKAKTKATKAAKKVKKAAKKLKKASKVTNGHNAEIFSSSKPALAEIVDLGKKKKPSDPYVRGLMDGVNYAIGDIGAGDFAPAWRTYLNRLIKNGDITTEA